MIDMTGVKLSNSKSLQGAPHGAKIGERSGGASLCYALSSPIRGERWSE